MQDKDKAAKEALLLAVCARGFQSGRTIVFFRTKKQAHRAKMLFGLARLPPAGELHGDMTQAMRLDSLDRFRKVRGPSLALNVFKAPRLGNSGARADS